VQKHPGQQCRDPLELVRNRRMITMEGYWKHGQPQREAEERTMDNTSTRNHNITLSTVNK
jgi:hypothetical protein